MLIRHHSLAYAYRNGHDIFEDYREQARINGDPIPRFRLILLNDRDRYTQELAAADGIHLHRIENPNGTGQIAAIWTSDEGEPPRFEGRFLCFWRKIF